MPRKPEWIEHLDAVETVLEGASRMLDRSDVEALFGVGSRQATRLLQRMGASRRGGAFLIESGELRSKVAQLRSEPGVVFEQRRRENVMAKLEQARRESVARRVVIPNPAKAGMFTELSEQIRLSRGSLHISFESPEELLRLLLELTQAISNDWDRFQAAAWEASQ